MSAILCSSKAQSVQGGHIEEDNAASAAESFSLFLSRISKNPSAIIIYSCSNCVLANGPVSTHGLTQQCICKKKKVFSFCPRLKGCTRKIGNRNVRKPVLTYCIYHLLGKQRSHRSFRIVVRTTKYLLS